MPLLRIKNKVKNGNILDPLTRVKFPAGYRPRQGNSITVDLMKGRRGDEERQKSEGR